jgi:ribosomal protein L33
MELSRERPLDGQGLLYPMMVIAAIAVIVFSVVGIASMTGWMPSSLISRAAAASVDHNGVATARSNVTFECAECGVIESMRGLEQSWGTGSNQRDQREKVAVLAD